MTCSLQVGDWTHAGGYGFALHHKLGVVVCKGDLNYIYFAMEIDTNMVLKIYSKTGGSNGKHAWADKTNLITTASFRFLNSISALCSLKGPLHINSLS